MTLHYKVSGEWEQVVRPYLKVGGKWIPVKEVYKKVSGVWERAYEFDVTPPDVPVISLEIVDTEYWDDGDRKIGRHLKIGVKTPGVSHVDDLKLIRVLARQADGTPPSTQFGQTYISGKSDNYPDEPWSDFSFNGHNRSSLEKDSSVFRYKTFPRNANNDSQLTAGTYYFTAWSLDDAGNWSVSAPAEIVVPKKGIDAAEIKIKEARFQSVNTGTLDVSGFTAGELNQTNKPINRGIWVYGNQIRNNIGSQGQPKIKSAQILVHRKNDGGAPMANIYLWWHDYAAVADIPVWDDIERHNITLLGQVAKGEAKWFAIPETHRQAMVDNNLKGFGLNNKDPDSAAGTAADFSIVKSIEDTLRTGEVHVVWTENMNLPATAD